MDNVKGVLIILVLLLTASSFYLFVKSSSQASQLESARTTNAATLELIRLEGGKCSALKTDFAGVGKCIGPLLLAKDFKEDSFSNPKEGQTGYLVIKNVNHRTYGSDRFTFLYNRQEVQRGCTITGNITYGITCRFNFEQKCVDGDVLEVTYTDDVTSKVFTKTC